MQRMPSAFGPHQSYNGARKGGNIALLLGMLRQINQLDKKPPLTLALMGIMYALHYESIKKPSAFRAYSLCPDKIVSEFNIARLLASAFLHGDDMHLYHNMISFLWKGYYLEQRFGSVHFGVLLGYLLVLSHSFMVFASILLAYGFQIKGPLHQCSIGFSAVLFALKVILNYSSPTYSNVYGIRVPTKYAAWIELVGIQFFAPNASFLGHICGIIAGYLYVKSPQTSRILNNISRVLENILKKMVNEVQNSSTSSRRFARSEPLGRSRT